LYEVKYNVA